MINLILLAAFLLLTQLPSFMARRIMQANSKDLGYLPGTGKELFNHLKKKYKLSKLKLEETPIADHFNPLTNSVHLTKSNLEGKSLTAVAVVTHEFSHALQHSEGYTLLATRTRLAKISFVLNKIASFAVLLGLSISAVLPRALFFVGVIWLASFLFSILIHLVTLPVELDASYKKALPILEEGEYLKKQDLAQVRKILGACAYTYIAQALSSFLFLILAFFRRGRPI